MININKNNKTLLVGLGNIGSKYRFTRHNAGFLFLDSLASYFKLSEQSIAKSKQTDRYHLNQYPELGILILKPQTMMNLSGTAVVDALNQTNIGTESIILIHDDLDLKLGEYKVQKAKSPKSHNGVISVETALGTKDFRRIRIGIENRGQENPINGIDYVLGKFSDEELNILDGVFKRIIETEFSLDSV